MENSIYLRPWRLDEYSEAIKRRGDEIRTENIICPRLWRVNQYRGLIKQRGDIIKAV